VRVHVGGLYVIALDLIMNIYQKDNGWMINGSYCEMVCDDFVDFQKSPRVTVRLAIGDIYTRKKGYGWKRKITALTWVDDCLMVEYSSNYGDDEWHTDGGCTAHALLNWGEK
tara:strand:+ start:338 stop:673 length:336 start_codon:yes stop_codon:yes gene_type:complete